MYRTMQVDGLTANFHISNVVRIDGEVDLQRLRESVVVSVGRHQALLVRLTSVPTGPVQIVDRDAVVRCESRDWRHLPAGERHAALQRLSEEFRDTPFDLARGPLYRLAIVAFEPQQCFLLMTFHHIVLDDWSMGLLLREIAGRYAGNTTESGARRDDYFRFVEWQRQWLGSAEGLRQAQFWEERLRGMPPVLELPTDRRRCLRIDNRCAAINASIPASQLHRLSIVARLSVFQILFTGFCVLIWRLSLRTRFPLATLVANREQEDFETTIGLFFNTIVLAIDVDPECCFSELARRTARVVMEGLQHASLPFLCLVENLCNTRDPTCAPLAQVLFSYVSAPQGRIDLGGATLQKGGGELDVGSGYDLRITACEMGNTINLVMQYRTALIEAATAQSWLNAYCCLMTDAALRPQTAVKDLRLHDGAPTEIPPGFAGRLPGGEWARRLVTGELDTWCDPGAVVQMDGAIVDTGSIACALLEFPNILEACVTMQSAGELVAHAVIAQEPAIDVLALKRHLFARLPVHAVPAKVRRVPRLPRRVGGVIDPVLLWELGSDLTVDVNQSAPPDERTAALLAVWSRTLRLPQLGIHDDFYSIGGNSLTGALIVAAVNREFGCKSTVRQLYEARTVARHAQLLFSGGSNITV
jgi:hypothetical protein